MGRRGEQRTAISIPILVRGKDSHGSPFVAATETCEISPYGACVKGRGGLDSVVRPGMKIEIQCHDEKACFQVEWVAERKTSQVGRFGVQCLEPGKYIWGVRPKEWKPDTYDASAPAGNGPSRMESQGSAPGAWRGEERRRFSRQFCALEALLTTEDASVQIPAKVTDVSLTGCYVEMMSPLPQGSAVNIAMKKDGKTVHTSAKVRFSHRGLGMGVVFTAIRPEDFDKLRELAQVAPQAEEEASTELTNSPLFTDQKSSPDPPPASTDALEAIMRVLFRKGIVTRAELSEELEKLKFVKV